tara:strand:- start:980 stop:1513 length:534 start_codon:yes stop_codon:yes gene_type:complete
MDTLENYFANNYLESNNKNINKCIASSVKGDRDCDLEPVNNYLDINEKMFKQISVYKKSHEKFKEVMYKLYTCPLVTGTEKESFKEGFKKLSEPGSEMFDIVDRNAKFYGDYRGCTSDVDNNTGKPENATLKDCNDVKQYWKSKGKETFINIPKKSNGLMYVIFFILALVLFSKLKK